MLVKCYIFCDYFSVAVISGVAVFIITVFIYSVVLLAVVLIRIRRKSKKDVSFM